MNKSKRTLLELVVPYKRNLIINKKNNDFEVKQYY